MTTARTKTPQASAAVPSQADEKPWYDLINEVPEPPEDGLVEEEVITLIRMILTARYANEPTTLVLGPVTFLIYDSDTPGSLIAPDCYVMFGVDAEFISTYRHSYRIQEWGVIPAFALEVASPSTARRDLTEKRELYARIGIGEYWRLDRTGENYGEPLVGERLVNGEYERLELHTEPNGDIWSRSEALGVDFHYRAESGGIGIFLLRDSDTGEWLNTLSDEIAARQQAESARQQAEVRAQEAEAHNQELQAELDRLRRQLDKR